ncbi:MAG: PEP-CTERM sorting domain-containing protein [Planctomycetota bacterium]|jgi:hypothetical protein
MKKVILTVLLLASVSITQAEIVYVDYAGIEGAAPLGVEGDSPAGWGTGSWQANVPVGAVSPTHYTNANFSSEQLFGRDITISELASVSYFTKKGELHSVDASDWFFKFYTRPYEGSPGSSWYGNRINAEPYFSDSLNAPTNTWNMWQTAAGEDNRLRFFDSSNNYFGSYTDGFLADLTADPDYANQDIWFFSVGLGTAWAGGFDGQIDGLTIELTDNTVATVNFEVPEPATMLLLGLGGLLLRRKK